MMLNDPDGFLRYLGQVVPAYQRFAPSAGSAPQQTNSGADANQGIDPNDPQPQADLQIGQNQYTYSQEQHAKFVAWEVRRQNRIAQQEQQRAQQAQAATYQRAQQELQAQFEAAKRDWPGFSDHHKAIAQMMLEQRIPMSEAYRRIVVPKLTTDRAKIRDEVLAELRQQPQSTSAPASSASTQAVRQTPASVEDHAWAALRDLQAGSR